MKEQVVAILNFHGVYDPAVVRNPSRLQSTAKHLKQEMDDAKAVRRAALNAKHLYQEVHQHENVRQRVLLLLSLKDTASKLLMWPTPTRSGDAIIRTRATYSHRIQSCRTTTSAPSLCQVFRLVHKLKQELSMPGQL
jgi:hypothetical protein